MNATLASLAKSLRWPTPQIVTREAGVQRHLIRLHTPPRGGHSIPYKPDFLDDNSAFHFLRRSIRFGEIGLVWCSGANLYVKDLLLCAELPDATGLLFGPDCVLTEGFGDEPTFGKGKVYAYRIDFTVPRKHNDREVSLLCLKPGAIQYPFKTAGTGLYHQRVVDSHSDELKKPMSVFMLSDEEQHEVTSAYEALLSGLELSVALLLDNDDVLTFRWNSDRQKFSESFFDLDVSQQQAHAASMPNLIED